MLMAPKLYLKALTGHLFLCVDKAGELFAQGIDHRHGHQQHGKQRDFQRTGFPYAHPGRIRLRPPGTPAVEQTGGQPVLRLENCKAAVPSGTVDPVAQEAQTSRDMRPKTTVIG